MVCATFVFCRNCTFFIILEEKHMRIILDTEKKTITVPWNYQQKLDELNKIISEVSSEEDKKKTFIGYLEENWNHCIANSDKCVVTGKKPAKK